MKSQIALSDIPFQAIPLSIETLSELSEITKGSLSKAIRRLIMVTSLDILSLKSPFTISDWQQAFHNNYCDLKDCSWASCPCLDKMTGRQLLCEIYNLSPELLTDNIGVNSTLKLEDLNSNLDRRVFLTENNRINIKTLEGDFAHLSLGQRSWLIGTQLLDKVERGTWIYKKGTRYLYGTSQHVQNLNTEEALTLIESLQVLEEQNPELSAIIEKIFPDADFSELTPRLLLRIDNITGKEKCDDIEDILSKLYEFWDRPISFKYKSSSFKQDNPPPCQVYPVRVVFYKRVKYLYAWGLDHKGNQNWYAYRLDRIELESLIPLNWTDLAHNSKLLQKYSKNNLPKPQDVKRELDLAWGTDIQEPIETLLLRFDPDYYESYIENTDRGATAHVLLGGADEAIELLESEYIEEKNPDDITRQNVTKSIDRINKHPHDPYFTAKFRLGDKYTKMQLRSWGAKVEVLAPFDLRKEIINEANDVIRNYD